MTKGPGDFTPPHFFMAEKKKKKLSEKQKAVLEKHNFKNKTPAERSELGARGAAKTNKIKEEKIKLEDSLNFIWGLKFDNAQKFEEWFDTLPPKEQTAVLLAILPKKQINEFSGGLEVQKVFVTPEMQEKTLEHIKKVINDK